MPPVRQRKSITCKYILVMVYVVMTYVVMAYVVMAYIVMGYIVMAYIVIGYTVMAYVVMHPVFFHVRDDRSGRFFNGGRFFLRFFGFVVALSKDLRPRAPTHSLAHGTATGHGDGGTGHHLGLA